MKNKLKMEYLNCAIKLFPLKKARRFFKRKGAGNLNIDENKYAEELRDLHEKLSEAENEFINGCEIFSAEEVSHQLDDIIINLYKTTPI